MKLNKPFIERLSDGTIGIRLEAIEEFMDASVALEEALVKVIRIVEDKQVNDALLDIYNHNKNPSSEVICRAFLAIKDVLKNVR